MKRWFRYCSKPSEKLILCANPVPCTLSERIEFLVGNSKKFLEDHRYDPFEIYAEEFRDELEEVPDPKTEPFAIYEEFLYILRTMGMYLFSSFLIVPLNWFKAF